MNMRFAKSSILSALALVFVANMAMAQQVIPGLRGKRFFIEPTFSTFPAYANATASSTTIYDGNSLYKLALPFRTGLGLHFVTSRRGNLMLRYEYFPTGLALSTYTPIPPILGVSINTDEHRLYFGLDAHIFSLGYEFSPKSTLSPVGPYTRLNLQYLIYNATMKDKLSVYQDFKDRSQNEHLPIGLDNVSGSDIGVGIDFGYRAVIAKKILLNWALCLNFNGVIFSPSISSNSSEKKSRSPDTYLATNLAIAKDAAMRRVAEHWIMVNVGIAYPF